MARKASGADQLEVDKGLLKKAKTVEDLRAVQAIALPLMLGLSLEQTAMVIGRSVGATCTMRNRFFSSAERRTEGDAKQARDAQSSESQSGARSANP